MLSNEIDTIIIVLDETFGIPRFLQDEVNTLVGIDVMPDATKTIVKLKKAGIRLILLVPEALSPKTLQDLKQFVPSVDDIIAYDQNLENTLSILSKYSPLTPQRTIFVAADRVLRGRAVSNGYLALPHLSIAAISITGSPLHFVRMIGDRKKFNHIQQIVPYYLEHSKNGNWILLAVLSSAAVSEAIVHRLSVEILPLDISKEDPLFVQLDRIDETSSRRIRDLKVLFSDGNKMLLAIGASVTNDSVPFHDKHGHFNSLVPDPTLFKSIPENQSSKTELILSIWPTQKAKVTRVSIDQSLLEEVASDIKPPDAESFHAYVNKYSGTSPLEDGRKIVSRHCEHPDNSRAVNALLKELRSMEYVTYTHPFYYTPPDKEVPIKLQNVIADLPGTGYIRFDPDLSEKIREIFLEYPNPNRSQHWINEVTQIVGKEWLKDRKLDTLSPVQLRAKLEEIFKFQALSPWWVKDNPLSGPDADIIIVGCHLDSTGVSTPGYIASTDPAPGADDDASGIAGTLAIARYLSHFRGRFRHTVRFCFFNAEEVGLKGSKVYSIAMRATDAPIKAVICMDMISYNTKIFEREFEIHAGYDDPVVRDRNIPIANLVKDCAQKLGRIGPAQIYKGTTQRADESEPEPWDRDKYDGAIRRSDHAAFHEHSYPAVVVTEDLFINAPQPPDQPRADSNPNYHTFEDTAREIDSMYAADIAHVVALAIKELANR